MTDYRLARELDQLYYDTCELLHPLNTPLGIFEKVIPPDIPHSLLLSLVSKTQKEITKNLDISQLPSDRTPGLIGQAALFKILRDINCDFSFYMKGGFDELGYMFLRFLGRAQCYVDYVKPKSNHDILSYYFTKSEHMHEVVSYEKMWVSQN